MDLVSICKVLVVALLGVLPIVFRTLSNNTYRLSLLGTTLSSFYSLYTLYGVDFLERAKPFGDDPAKQERFERFLKDIGIKAAFIQHTLEVRVPCQIMIVLVKDLTLRLQQWQLRKGNGKQRPIFHLACTLLIFLAEMIALYLHLQLRNIKS